MENNWFLKIEFLEKSLESAEEENRKLREEIEGWKSANDINLQMFEEEIERLKGLVEKSWIDGFDKGEGYQNNPLHFEELFNKFKGENNIK